MKIREKDKETIRKIFSSLGLPVEVWAYGSRVNGNAHEGSDLDLVIRNKNLNPFPQNVITKLRKKLRESNLPILVDVFDWAMLPGSFHKNIEANHEVLFSNLPTNLQEPETDYGKKTS